MPIEMRKIETKEELERKRKRNTLILSILMIGILLLSSVGYFSLREDEESEINNQKVQNMGDYWIFKYGEQNIRLSNPPESAENVSIMMFKSLEDYYGKTIYVSTEKEGEFYEIASALGAYGERMQEACYGKCDKNLPEKNCSDVLIVVRRLNETTKNGEGKIYEEDNCVFIEGELNAVDAFIYKIFGII